MVNYYIRKLVKKNENQAILILIKFEIKLKH